MYNPTKVKVKGCTRKGKSVKSHMRKKAKSKKGMPMGKEYIMNKMEQAKNTL